MKKFVLLSFLAILPSLFIMAQGSVKGKVTDADSQEPLGFVNVAVSPKGSTQIAGGVATDLDGNFEVTGLKEGQYVLTVSFVGYVNATR